MGWLRTVALSRNQVFPPPIVYVEWELYPPHAHEPIPGVPTNQFPRPPQGAAALQSNAPGEVGPTPALPP